MDDLLARRHQAELELEAKGYPAALAAAATRRALEAAASTARRVRPGIRAQVAFDLLEDELRGCEDWIAGVQGSMTEPAQPATG